MVYIHALKMFILTIFFYSIVAELRCDCKLMNPNKYTLRNIPDQSEKLLNSQVEK